MKRALVILACCCLLSAFCFAQRVQFGRSNAFKPVATGWTDTGYPTNIPSYPALCWYPVHGNYDSVGGTLTNRGLAGSSYDLTNAASPPSLASAALNSKDVLHFQNQFLRAANYTSTQPFEVWMILRQTNFGTAARYLWSDNNSTFGSVYFIQRIAEQDYATYATGDYFHTGDNTVLTNAWTVFTFTVNGTSSIINTNNVSSPSTGDTWTGNPNGMHIGGRKDNYAGTLFGGDIAEIAIYTNLLTAALRSNLWVYFTNKYALPQ